MISEAIVELYIWYKNPVLKNRISGCSLCRAVQNNCFANKCPWIRYEKMKCNNWNCDISSIRLYPLDHPEEVQQRIVMLEKWMRYRRIKIHE
jgi:hypothetical protein